MNPTGLAALEPLTGLLSPTELRRVAASLEIDGQPRRAARTVTAEKRSTAGPLLDHLVEGFGNPRALGTTLRTLAATVESRPRPPVLVWSGPQLPGDSVKTTEAIVRLIDDAEESVLASTYSATVKGPFLTALRRAAERQLQITIVADVVALGKVAEAIAVAIPRATMYGFHHHDGQHQGLQHSKLLVIDGKTSLVTSANLSIQAVDWNLEAGVLVEDIAFSGQISRRISDLIASDHLRPLR